MNVVDLADIVCKKMEISDVHYTFSGTKRGWIGDTPFVHLDISKISSLGWIPGYNIKDGIIDTVGYLKNNDSLLNRR